MNISTRLHLIFAAAALPIFLTGFTMEQGNEVWRLLWLGGGALILLAGYVTSRRLLKPVSQLSNAALALASGQRDVQIANPGTDELGQLARTFNQMVVALDSSTIQKELVHNILQSIADALFVLNRQARIQQVNQAATRILGYGENELLGQNMDFLIPDRALLASVFRDVYARGAVSNLETNFRTNKGEEIPVSLSCNILTDSKGEALGAVFLVQDISERKRDEERLHFLANFDVLTKLPNRTLFLERLTQALSRAPWTKRLVGICYLGLDRFKVINDTLGHQSGDFILQEVANRLKCCIRQGDTVARIGGDEFVVLLVDVARPEDLQRFSRKAMDAVAAPIPLDKGQEIYLTGSVGISLFPESGLEPDVLFKHADIAMQHAKVRGKNQIFFYNPELNARADERMAVENALRHALARQEFRVFYQPRVNLESRRIVGAEALVRWFQDGRMMPPMAFLPTAQEIGIMADLDLWVLREACRQTRSWRDQGLCAIRISVNLSHQLFNREDLIPQVNNILLETGLPSDCLELELTEEIVMRNVNHTIEALEHFRTRWIRLAIDDFGTGYSSFGHLKRLPIHTLKIDRSFVRDITTKQDDAAITSAIIAMAHTLKLKVTAEGVENAEQMEMLASQNCDEIQGYFISPPVPAEQFESLLQRERW
ncbi:MAG: EAL domain-containing protein [Magnetococcales bacterium]|nr:EAL domain-containing protein [Magnetococcales bacterium]